MLMVWVPSEPLPPNVLFSTVETCLNYKAERAAQPKRRISELQRHRAHHSGCPDVDDETRAIFGLSAARD
jgi:hypothetical protein